MAEPTWPGALHLRRLSIVVLVAGTALALGGFFLARAWVDHSREQRLADEARRTAAVVSSFGRQVEALLTAGSVVAAVTGGDAEAFERTMGERVRGTAISSITLLERTGDRYVPLAGIGDPLLVERFRAADVRRIEAIVSDFDRLALVRIDEIAGSRVTGFAIAGGSSGRLAVYAESVAGTVASMFSLRPSPGLAFAVYVDRVSRATLLASSTDDLPIGGRTAEVPLRFGSEMAVLVIGGDASLVGGLTAASPWLILGLGFLLALGLALMVELVRRRAEADAERGALETQNRRLRELDRMKDELVATVSHELRTPLTSILGYLELLREDEHQLTGEHRDFLEVMERNARRLLTLVGDLLFVARLDAEGLRLELHDVDLAAVARDCVEAHRPRAELAGLELHLDAEDVVLEADRARLAQLVDNLVSNAIKFTPRGGKVVVRVAEREGSAVLAVEDTGIGIPAPEQARLFERFFRSSTATTAAVQGTGLGLAIARAIVGAHGGSIQATSEEGRGTAFTVRLPLRRSDARVADRAAAMIG